MRQRGAAVVVLAVIDQEPEAVLPNLWTAPISPWINRRLAEGLDLTGSAVATYTIQINQIAGQVLQRQIEASRPSS
jgi:hypothetical protein